VNIPEHEAKYLKRIPLKKLDEYIGKSLCAMPWEGFSGDISDRINESMNYFYWVFGETVEALENKQYYRPEPQYLPGISKFLSDYVKTYGIIMDSTISWNEEYLKIISKDKKFKLEDYEDTEYQTFNDFFTRRVKPEKRPISNGFVAPVDGAVLNVLGIKNGKADFEIKTSSYHEISKLLGKDCYQQGTLIDMFLDIYDYHRFHAPVDMKILDVKKINGGNYVGGFIEYLNGKYVLDSSEYGWQSIETRVVIEAFNEHFGNFCIVPVGMSHVGSIEIKCVEGNIVKKGDEIGLFKFGGSCVILILEKKIYNIAKNHYLMGETLFEEGGVE